MKGKNIRSRKISKIYGSGEVDSKGDVKFGCLLEDLLLFDTVVVQTQRLNELPFLVESFGFGPVRDLIRSGALELSMLNPQIGVRNSDDTTWGFECGAFALDDFQKVIGDSLQEVQEKIPVEETQFRELEKAVHESFEANPKENTGALSKQFRSEITRGSHVVYNSLDRQADSKFGIDLDLSELDFNVEYVGESGWSGFDVFEVDTNLPLLINTNARKAIDLIGDALLGVGGLNSRLNKMRMHQSLSGIRQEDRSMLDSKISWAMEALPSDVRTDQFGRVVTIKDFPDLHELALQGQVDLEKLMQLRRTDEISQFRNWLQRSSSLSEKELERRLNSFKAKLGSLLQSEQGKLVRWITSVGISLAVQNPAPGAFAGFVDQFFVDDLLDSSGPICFINNLYPPIYTGQ
jgi:hypothetical protein